jgi:hypothetical protein
MSINLLLKNWIPKNLTRQQRVMAEEILDKNSHDHAVTILPSNEGNEPGRSFRMVRARIAVSRLSAVAAKNGFILLVT